VCERRSVRRCGTSRCRSARSRTAKFGNGPCQP
jgi:hypothetical protein